MICTVPSLAHPDGLYPFLNRVSFPHNKTPKVICPTFGVHYTRVAFLFTELQGVGTTVCVVAIDPDVFDTGVEGLADEGTPTALI